MDEVKLLPCPELVERVARSIAAAKRDPITPPEEIDRVWNGYCGQARAAIKASGLQEEVEALRHDLERTMDRANEYMNRSLELEAELATHPTLVTDELVERSSAAAYENFRDRHVVWADLNPAEQEMWRRAIRAAIRASLAAMPTLVTGQLEGEVERLTALLNTPEVDDFAKGAVLEAAHQRERWGADHDAGKSPFDWFWLVGYLAQKAAASAVAGDTEKAKHHTISTAAALANWHLALSGTDTIMRPGIGPGNGGEKIGSAYDLATRAHPQPGPSQ